MKKLSGRVASVNILGTLGYMSSLLAWLLFVAIFFVLLANSSFMTMPNEQPSVQTLAIPDNLTNAVFMTSYGVTIIAVVVTIIIFVTLPHFMSKGLSRFMRHLLKLLKMPQTNWHMWLVKALITTIPAVGLAIITLLGARGDTAIAIYTVVFFAALLALGLFAFQYLLAWRFAVASKDIW